MLTIELKDEILFRARAMDGSPDLKWRGARKMDNKKRAESVEVTPSEAVTERNNNALPSFISYTSTDTKASQIYDSILFNQNLHWIAFFYLLTYQIAIDSGHRGDADIPLRQEPRRDLHHPGAVLAAPLPQVRTGGVRQPPLLPGSTQI